MLESGKDHSEVARFLESAWKSVFDTFATVNAQAQAWELQAKIDTSIVPAVKKSLKLQ